METEVIFNKVLSKIKPSEQEENKIKEITKKFINLLEKQIKKQKIKAEVFIGGSLAKGTIIKKDRYDIDIFVRFDKKYKNISEILEKILKKLKLKAKIKVEKIKGSRDYFSCKFQGIYFEIVPVKKISRPREAENVTDLSYFHVDYVKKQLKKNKKLADEIRLAKAFCYSVDCYGAESYIAGFSGYALELLVIYYKTFKKFIQTMTKVKEKEQLIIDPKKFYKNKQDLLFSINEAKLQSPIIFIDPTFKERNAIAGLSHETFSRFKKASLDFLKKPTANYFQSKQENIEKWKKKTSQLGADLLILEVKSERKKQDIAGAKLKKFYDFIRYQLKKNFEIKEAKFEFQKNKARYFFILKMKKEIIIQGPPVTKVENLTRFRKKHKNAFIKERRAFVKIKGKKISEFYKEFLKKNKKTIKEMSIISLRKL